MSELRAIETESYAPIEPKGEVGPTPMLQWLKIADLVVDDSYQRPLLSGRVGKGNNAGRQNVRRIAENFRWSKFSTVIVAPVEGGKYAIIDGQHHVTGAALRGIESVPCQIVIADRAEQADAFASINGNVTRMTALALHHAAVAAGDPQALALDRITKAAGVRILRGPTAREKLKAGETMSIAVMASALRAYGESALLTGLRCITATRHNQPGAVSAMVIRALACVAAAAPDGDELVRAFGRIDLDTAVRKAEAMRAGGIPAWSALADELKRRLSHVLAPSPRPPANDAGAAGSTLGVPKKPPLSERDMDKALAERPTVSAKRAAGAPWSAIARMLNTNELDLRRRHDPEFAG